MGKRNKLIIGFYGSLLIGILFLAFSANPPDGHTGAPGDSLCSACHNTPPASVQGVISLTGLPATVTHNTTYTLTLTSTVTMGSAATAGFQLVALNASNQNVGNLTANSPDVGTDITGGREYVEHRGDKAIVGGTVSWSFDWTAPASGSGAITMYAASNLTNNSGTNAGDRIITNNFSTSLTGGGNPVTVAITNSVNVSCFGGNNGSATAQASNGTPPYSYNWSNGQSGATATNLAAGTYTVTASDSGGGTATAMVTITQPPLLVASITSQTNVLCFGGNNGAAVAGASGGTPPYTYAWSNGQSGPAIFNLTAGSYTVTVTDSKSCTKTAVAVITQPPLLVVNIVSQNNVSCFGGNNGSAAVTGAGGTPAYSYAWSNGASGPVITNLAAGSYTVTASDSHGCTATKTVVITQPALLVASIGSVNNVSCNGEADGSATASATGGTTPYSYLWSNGATTATASGLTAGTYTVTITDDHNCTDTESVTITQPPGMTVGGIITTPTCAGDCNGGISSEVVGGVQPLSYLWSSGETTSFITGICAGSYSLTVTDANDCSEVAVFNVEEPDPVVIEVTFLQHVDCFGNTTGGIEVTGSGGPGPITYLWENGVVFPGIFGLPAGEYSVTVTNGIGCTAELTVEVTEPAPLDPNASATHETANNANDGTATAAPTGGTPPYSYEWSNGQTTATITGLAPGTYTVTVTDDNGCTEVESVMVNPFGCNLAVVFEVVPVSCSGGNDGTAMAIPVGGTPAYSFNWSNGGTQATITGLTAGTYTVTITDGSACTAIDDVVVIEPPQLEASVVILQQVECFGDATGSASVEGSGGLPGTHYTYIAGDTIATLPPGEAFVLGGLVAGTYSVTVTDENDCEISVDFTITQPAELTADVTSTNETANNANDGTASAAVQGGTGAYSYLWSNGETTASIGGLSPGAYQVTVTDENGCTVTGEAVVEEYVCTLALDVDFTDVLCNGESTGTAEAIPSGGVEPYAYEWSNGATEASVSGLPAGTYTVTVTDDANCPAEAEVVIGEPAALTLALDSLSGVSCNGGSDGYASVVAGGGTPGYSYAWSNGTAGPAAQNLAAGTYTVTVLDDNLCETTLEVVVSQPDPLDPQASSTNESSNGAGDGTASVAPVGGTQPYSVLWSTGETTETITGLIPGVYSVTVTDDNGCTAEASVAVNPFNCELAVTAAAENVSCAGANDGSIQFSVSGATDPVEVTLNGELWEGGDTIPGLGPGVYDLTVIDAAFCIHAETFEITEPDTLEVIVLALEDLICAGEEAGLISVAATGGTPAYSWLWDDGSTETERDGLPAGTYSVTATDDNGCEAALSVEINEVVLEWELVSVTPVECAGEPTGGAELSVSGGSIPYEFLWPNGETGPSQTGLTGGTYFPTITDANGCSVVAEVEIPSMDSEAPVVLTQDVTILLDGDGNAVLDPSALDAGSSDNCEIGAFSASQTGFSCADLGENQVELTVTDLSGNSAAATALVTVLDTVPPLLLCPDNIVVMVCPGDLASVDYTLTWGDNCTAQPPLLLGGLSSGSVFPLGTTTVSWGTIDQSGNAAGCSFDVTVSELSPAVIEVQSVTDEVNGQGNGSIDITVTGGLPPYAFEWSLDGEPVSDDEDPENLSAGIYVVVVTDANGCIYFSDQITVDNITATEEAVAGIQFSIFPNPAGEYLWVEWTGAARPDLKAELLDINGKVMQQIPLETAKTKLNTSGLAPGVYVLSLYGDGWKEMEKILIIR